MNYLYNSEPENKDTTTVHCSWVKLKASTPVCFILNYCFDICYSKFSFMEKVITYFSKKHKGKDENISWKRLIQMLYKKLQQIIIVGLQ